MSGFSPQDLVYFQEIARSRNLSRAAERLGVAQPSLTLAVKRLETQTGTPLLIRKKTGVELTHAGRTFLQHSEQVLREWNQLLTETRASASEVRGRFKIGCHASVAQYALPAFLPQLSRTHPGLELALVHGLSRHITEGVVRHDIDFGIVVNPVPHPDLRIALLGTDTVTLFLSAQCLNPDLLIHDPELAQSQAIVSRLKKARAQFRRELHSSSLEVIARLAAEGAGVGILPSRVASAYPKLRPWKSADGTAAPRFEDRICLVYRTDSQKTRASREIISAISGCLN
jgi:DNA-binding transcriptional LysR family regulator